MSYDQEVIDLIKQISGRVYNQDTSTWNMPNQAHEEFINKITEMKNYKKIRIEPLEANQLEPEIYQGEIINLIFWM